MPEDSENAKEIEKILGKIPEKIGEGKYNSALADLECAVNFFKKIIEEKEKRGESVKG